MHTIVWGSFYSADSETDTKEIFFLLKKMPVSESALRQGLRFCIPCKLPGGSQIVGGQTTL